MSEPTSPPVPDDETELIQKASSGDFDAFEVLVGRTEAKLYHHLLRLLDNASDAKELLQETYLSAYRNLKNFQGKSSFSTWLYRIATNHALMHFRRKKPEDSYDELPIPTHEELKNRNITDWDLDPESAAHQREVKKILEEAMSQLPEMYRAVVLLRDIRGMSTTETAEILGIQEGAVKTRLHRARIFLREILSRHFGPEEFLTDKAEQA